MFKTSGFGQLSFDQPFVKLLAKNIVDSTRLSVDNGVNAGETWEGDRGLHFFVQRLYFFVGGEVDVASKGRNEGWILQFTKSDSTL